MGELPRGPASQGRDPPSGSDSNGTSFGRARGGPYGTRNDVCTADAGPHIVRQWVGIGVWTTRMIESCADMRMQKDAAASPVTRGIGESRSRKPLRGVDVTIRKAAGERDHLAGPVSDRSVDALAWQGRALEAVEVRVASTASRRPEMMRRYAA